MAPENSSMVIGLRLFIRTTFLSLKAGRYQILMTCFFPFGRTRKTLLPCSPQPSCRRNALPAFLSLLNDTCT